MIPSRPPPRVRLASPVSNPDCKTSSAIPPCVLSTVARRWYDLEVRKITDAPEIYDISPMLSERTAVFPQDVPFSRELTLNFESGNRNLLLSSIRTTVHLGAHTDAPNHYDPNGASIDERSLAYYLGPCQVISVRLRRGERIRSKDLDATGITASRVLFKTGSFPQPDC